MVFTVNTSLHIFNTTSKTTMFHNGSFSPSSSLYFTNSTVSTTTKPVDIMPLKEPLISMIIRLILTSAIFLCTVIGNSLTIHVIRSNPKLTSIKNYYYGYYILNLSISDMLVGFICVPFTVIYYLTDKWPFGSFLCRLLPTLQVMVISASISTLTVITFERFMAIVHPLKPRSTIRRLKITICIIWIWSFIAGLPTFINMKLIPNLPIRQCQEVWPHLKYRQAYTIFLFLVNYAIPLTFIFTTYCRIIYELQSRENLMRTPGHQALHKKFLKLMLILVLGFALCYLPGNIIYFLLDFADVSPDDSALMMAMNYSHVLIWSNSCLNPFIYGSLDTYFKRGFKRAVGMHASDSQERYSTTNSAIDQESHLFRASSRCSYKASPKSENKRTSENLYRFSPVSTPDLNQAKYPASPERQHTECLCPSALEKACSNNNGIKERPLSAGKGYISLVLFQSKNKTNFCKLEELDENEDNKDSPVDIPNDKQPFEYQKLSARDFMDSLKESNETNV